MVGLALVIVLKARERVAKAGALKENLKMIVPGKGGDWMALTAKQKRFCEEYVSNGFKLQKAYLDSHPDASPATANVNSWKLMKSEAIKGYIKELQKERVE